LIEGTADGVRMAEVAGKTTKLTACPIGSLEKLMRRPESQKTAVYLLVGSQFETTDPAIYIGECDAVSRRFNGHHGAFEKADWRLLVVASTSDSIFNKAHARRVEHLLVERAKAADRSRVFTEKSGPGDLDEGDAAVAEAFLADTVMLAETLGVDAFRGPASPSTSKPVVIKKSEGGASDPALFRFIGEPSLEAKMRVVGDECVVLSGSTARLVETDGCPPSVRAARSKAQSLGLLATSEDGKALRVVSDIPTGSPSGAGGLVAGRACRGPTEWVHVSSGQTYGIWLQSKQTEAASL
jgi:hypothetical protein